MTFIYTPPEPDTYGLKDFVTRLKKPLFTEAKLHSEVERVRRETVEACAKPDPQLCKFYDVQAYPELVAAMEHHIRKLQAKLPIRESFTHQKVREG